MARRDPAGFFCSRCERVKRADAFYVNLEKAHGLSHWCKSCMADTERARRKRRRGDRPDGRQPYWTRERIIAAIKSWGLQYGEPPSVLDWRHRGADRPTSGTVIARFGRWNTAIEAAGLKPRYR